MFSKKETPLSEQVGTNHTHTYKIKKVPDCIVIEFKALFKIAKKTFSQGIYLFTTSSATSTSRTDSEKHINGKVNGETIYFLGIIDSIRY